MPCGWNYPLQVTLTHLSSFTSLDKIDPDKNTISTQKLYLLNTLQNIVSINISIIGLQIHSHRHCDKGSINFPQIVGVQTKTFNNINVARCAREFNFEIGNNNNSFVAAMNHRATKAYVTGQVLNPKAQCSGNITKFDSTSNMLLRIYEESLGVIRNFQINVLRECNITIVCRKLFARCGFLN